MIILFFCRIEEVQIENKDIKIKHLISDSIHIKPKEFSINPKKEFDLEVEICPETNIGKFEETV